MTIDDLSILDARLDAVQADLRDLADQWSMEDARMALTNAADYARRVKRGNLPGARARYYAQNLEKACGELLLDLVPDELATVKGEA